MRRTLEIDPDLVHGCQRDSGQGLGRRGQTEGDFPELDAFAGKRVSRLARGTVVFAMSMVPGCIRPETVPAASPVRDRPIPGPRTCEATDLEGLARCVDAERLRADVERFAVFRPPGSAGWRKVQRGCDEVLSSHGFDVRLQPYETGVNVIGRKRGTSRPDEVVMLGAHYDHVPGCEGADDNASGVAAVLEAARILGPLDLPRTLVVACWDEEERGLLGSRAWTTMAASKSGDHEERIVVYFNFDAVANVDRRPGAQRIPDGFELLFPDEVDRLREREDRADFIALITNASARGHADAWGRFASRIGQPHVVLEIPELLRAVPVAPDLQRSDHASFWWAGLPAVMVTDTANYRSDAYHCGGRPDTPDTLDYGVLAAVVQASIFATASALTLADGERLSGAVDPEGDR